MNDQSDWHSSRLDIFLKGKWLDLEMLKKNNFIHLSKFVSGTTYLLILKTNGMLCFWINYIELNFIGMKKWYCFLITDEIFDHFSNNWVTIKSG